MKCETSTKALVLLNLIGAWEGDKKACFKLSSGIINASVSTALMAAAFHCMIFENKKEASIFYERHTFSALHLV